MNPNDTMARVGRSLNFPCSKMRGHSEGGDDLPGVTEGEDGNGADGESAFAGGALGLPVKAVLLCLLFLWPALPARAVLVASRNLRVGSLTFEGNEAFSDGTLRKVCLTQPSGLFHKTEYLPDVLEKDLVRLADFYHRRGFLQAGVEDKEVTVSKDGRKADLTVWVYEGPESRIGAIRFEGIHAFTAKKILGLSGLKTGEPLDRDQVESAIRNLSQAYLNEGYLEAVILPENRWEPPKTDPVLVFKISEGPLCRLWGITLSGLTRSRDWVVRREFRIRPGEALKWNQVEKAQQRLYLTGIFQTVYARPVTAPSPAPEGSRVLALEVRENKPKELDLSTGWSTEEHLRGKATFSNINLFGRARQFTVTATASRLLQRLDGTYTVPWTLGVPWFTSLNLFGEIQNQPGYSLRTGGGLFSFGRHLSSISQVQLTYRHENAFLSSVVVVPAPDISLNFIRSFGLSLLLDERDNFVSTQRGLYLNASAEMSGSFLHGSDTFFKATGAFKWFHPVTSSTVIGTAAQVGWVGNYRSLNPIPLSELFYAGGSNALRGFPYQGAGPLDPQRVPLGGQFELVLNAAELRQRVWKWLGVVGFFDAGNIFPNLDKIRWGDIRTTGGWGLRLTTKLGVLRADQGFIVNPRPGEKRQVIYLNVGQAF